MDATALQMITEQAVIILTAFASKLEDALDTNIVDVGLAQAKRLYESIKQHFQREDDKGSALKALEHFQEEPQEYQINLNNKLVHALQSDEAFAQVIAQHIQQGPLQEILASDRARVIANAMHNRSGQGRQTIDASGDAHVEGNNFNIG